MSTPPTQGVAESSRPPRSPSEDTPGRHGLNQVTQLDTPWDAMQTSGTLICVTEGNPITPKLFFPKPTTQV